MTKQEKEEFFDYVKTLPDYQKIINDYDPDIIYFGGSRATGLANDESDYDLVAKIPDSKLKSSFNFINIKIHNDRNWCIHCMITSLRSDLRVLLEDDQIHNNIHVLSAWTVGLNNLKENTIYTKNNTSDIYNYVIENKKPITELLVYNLLLKYRDELNSLDNEFTTFLNSKIYYHLLMYYDEINHTDNSWLIKKIKEHQLLTNEEHQIFEQKIKQIIAFYKNFNPKDYNIIKAELEMIVQYGEWN